MQTFAALLDRLYYTHSTNDKAAVLTNYLSRTPDPDRGWALAASPAPLTFDLFKRALVRDLVAERVDPVLLALSYDYIGEMSETVAHIWPRATRATYPNRLPPLHEVIHEFQTRDKPQIRDYLALLAGQYDAAGALGAAEAWHEHAAHWHVRALGEACAGGVRRRGASARSRRCGMRSSRLISISSPGSKSAGLSRTASAVRSTRHAPHSTRGWRSAAITPADFTAEWKYRRHPRADGLDGRAARRFSREPAATIFRAPSPRCSRA